MSIKDLLTEISDRNWKPLRPETTRINVPAVGTKRQSLQAYVASKFAKPENLDTDVIDSEILGKIEDEEVVDELAKEATASVDEEPLSDNDDQDVADHGSSITALGFDVTGKPIRSRLFSQTLTQQLKISGIRSAKDVVWVNFNPEIAQDLVKVCAEAIKETLSRKQMSAIDAKTLGTLLRIKKEDLTPEDITTLKTIRNRKELSPEVADILKNIHMDSVDETFLTNLQTSLAKIYVLYSSWYYDVLIMGDNGQLGAGDSLEKRRNNATVIPMTKLVGKANKNLTSPTEAMRSYMKAFFQKLPDHLQKQIIEAPDATGTVERTLKFCRSKTPLRNSIEQLLQNKVQLSEAISNSVNQSDNIEELLTISSEESFMRAIIKGIVQLKNPANPMTFEKFETFVMGNVFSERDERKLNKQVATLAPMEFTSDDGTTKERELDAAAEREGDADYMSMETGSDKERSNDENALQAAQLDEAGGVWKGINLFHEIDNANFSALFITLLKQKYIEKNLDHVLIPETPGNQGIIEPATVQSLFEWLHRLEAPATKSQSTEGELYSYNEALIDFINIFSDQLKDSRGSSLPTDFSGSLPDAQQEQLKEALELFGRKYHVPSLQLIATKSKTLQQANQELYARNTVLGGTNRAKLNELLRFDFLSIVEREIGEDVQASTGAKQNTLTSVDAVISSPLPPVMKYLAILQLLYKFNPDHGAGILAKAARFNKEDKEIYSPIHTAVRDIITGKDEKSLTPAKKRGYSDLRLFGIVLPDSYPPAETLLFSPVATLQNMIEQIEEAHLESLGSEAPLKDLYYYKEHLLKKLHAILLLKQQGLGTLKEAVEPVRQSKAEVTDRFIAETLPLMDNVLVDGRKLVRFLRNFVRSSNPRAYFDAADPLIQNEKSGDFRRTQKAISEPPQQNLNGVEDRGLSKRAILSLVRGYIANAEANNARLFEEIFDKQEKQTLEKLVGLLKNFALLNLKTNPDVSEEDLSNFLNELHKVGAQIKNPEVTEVNLDGIKKYLKLFQPILIAGLVSVKNGQSGSVSMLLKFLAANTLGHVIGINKSDVINDLKKGTEEREVAASRKIRPEIVPALVDNPWAEFDQPLEDD